MNQRDGHTKVQMDRRTFAIDTEQEHLNFGRLLQTLSFGTKYNKYNNTIE